MTIEMLDKTPEHGFKQSMIIIGQELSLMFRERHMADVNGHLILD